MSRRSGCTRATWTGCSRCCTGCATAATRCSSWSTISRRFGARTTWWSSGQAAASRAATSCSRVRCRARARARSPARISPASARSRCPRSAARSARAGSLSPARASTTCSGVDVRIPLGALTVVTGVSGSGKSTLVHDVLLRALETRLTGEHSAKQHLGERVGAFDALTGYEPLDDVVCIDQSPIGKSPRSNPVTYVKAFDEIRRIFADAAARAPAALHAGHVQLQRDGRPLRELRGRGLSQVEMVFMADVFVPCDECGGKRFKPEVLEVKVRGKSIYDVLEMTVDQAIRFFPREEKLGQALWQLQQVGLGYLRLGQPATTLLGRRGAAHEDRARARDRGQDEAAEALHHGRADDGPAPRGHPQARARASIGSSTRATRSC